MSSQSLQRDIRTGAGAGAGRGRCTGGPDPLAWMTVDELVVSAPLEPVSFSAAALVADEPVSAALASTYSVIPNNESP